MLEQVSALALKPGGQPALSVSGASHSIALPSSAAVPRVQSENTHVSLNSESAAFMNALSLLLVLENDVIELYCVPGTTVPPAQRS